MVYTTCQTSNFRQNQTVQVAYNFFDESRASQAKAQRMCLTGTVPGTAVCTWHRPLTTARHSLAPDPLLLSLPVFVAPRIDVSRDGLEVVEDLEDLEYVCEPPSLLPFSSLASLLRDPAFDPLLASSPATNISSVCSCAGREHVKKGPRYAECRARDALSPRVS